MNENDLNRAAETFVGWLQHEIIASARGDDEIQLAVEPAGKFWLGRLAPESSVVARGLGDRGERLDPCACGLRIRTNPGPQAGQCEVRLVLWLQSNTQSRWTKTPKICTTVPIELNPDCPVATFGRQALTAALSLASGAAHFAAEIRVERGLSDESGTEWEITLVNDSQDRDRVVRDTNFYECELRITGLATKPFLLESLPQSFRYDRRVVAYGINCGVDFIPPNELRTIDVPVVSRARPTYWSASTPLPDFRFQTLAEDPLSSSRALLEAMRAWGLEAWGATALDARASSQNWTKAMRAEADVGAMEFERECRRVEKGIRLLEANETLRQSFKLMNRSMTLASRHERWRPFQFGFLLANLSAVVEQTEEASIADIVWFATGGGKTETYLGMILSAAFHDRLVGKSSGVTAWSRFPLRMLSLQQTQRFADALAAGERVRVEAGLVGDPFSLGFFVGSGATPNKISEDPGNGDFDYESDEEVQRARVLLHCPFCRSEDVRTAFDRRLWKLTHHCTNVACWWPKHALPFYIVDDEIYRFLPTVIVGTLDKAAAISMQASMRGLVGAPWGSCSVPGHGYVYAPRAKRPHGCLVPGCNGTRAELPMDPRRYGPTFRLQDELHLLKDSLGAVDAHYEALYDDLQRELCGSMPKILASSATLEGYERQVATLYGRRARVFPQPGPSVAEGFWTTDSTDQMRQYFATAPRGVTLEYAVDRLLTELQTRIRSLIADPAGVCARIGIDPKFALDLISLYGTNVVYGNTIRDLEAVTRSIGTQIAVEGVVNHANLTGRTDFDEVRQTLHRLEHPNPDFASRLHIVTASSMMSHGVDIDRLNIMVMLGLPLTTAEFIQATARVGRTWPGLVIVVPKIGRERDAAMYRCFREFVTQGDRLIEPIPITRRSRRVLERTIAGLALARILILHEPSAPHALTTVSRLRDYLRSGGIVGTSEAAALERLLGFTEDRDAALRADIYDWFDQFQRNLSDPPAGARFPSDASPSGDPMRSLRDVEEQVPVFPRYTT